MTLLAAINATEFSADSGDLFSALAVFGPADEVGKVVLSAAASVLATAAIAQGRDVFDLIDEFGELVETFDFSLRARADPK